MATTFLARQLQTIRSETAATLDKRKHDRVASLLFDPLEAANQDYDAVLALGQNGLHGLVQLDTRFRGFEQTLFVETAKEIDRAILVVSMRCCANGRRKLRMRIGIKF
jgi:U3 small nucleolar RNA-associated protein 10